MKKKYILLGVLSILVVLGFLFKETLQDIYLLTKYSNTFKPQNVAQSFRSLYKEYPASEIAKSKTTYKLHRTNEIELPNSFIYKDSVLDISNEIKKRNFTSLLILKNDSLVYERYYNGNEDSSPVNVFSCTKSMVSLLIGIAHQEGDIPDLNATAGSIVTSLRGTVYEKVRIQNLLDMASGVQWVEDYDDLNSEIVQSILAFLKGSINDFSKQMKRDKEQGVFNQYTSMDTQILAMVLEAATNHRLEKYFYRKIWSRIGAEDKAYFLEDKTGTAIGYAGLIVSARDLAKIGLLVKNGGINFQNQQIIDSVWIGKSTKADKPYLIPGDNPASDYELGYKNQWWLPVEDDGGDFSAVGIYGQFLYINPKRNIVIVSNGAYGNYPLDYEADIRKMTMLQAIAKQIDIKL
ncbi:MAG: beta-lactamase family protein [Flavobacteriaceae bacterium]|nr:beta-lactamase family protein [Flavobacteriaceae bacterium]